MNRDNVLERDEKSDERRQQIRRMFDCFSHDLRSPLTSIKTSADLLRNAGDQLDDATRAELVVIIDEEATRLNRAIERLLWIGRLELQEIELERRVQPLDAVIHAAIAHLNTRLRTHGLKLELATALPAVSIDGTLIQLVFEYLLDNAVKFSPVGSEIKISARVVDAQIEIIITDQGRGIAPDVREQIFDKLYRSARLFDEDCHRVGMSLAICRGIIMLHNGRIWADGEQGASIHLEIPINLEIPAVSG